MKQKTQDVVNEKYQPKKLKNLDLVKLMGNKISEKGVIRMLECSTFNQFIATSDKQTKKLVASNPCKNRFCPICTYRKARKDALMLSVIMQAISAEENYEFLFLTLTTPNVPSDELKSEIDRFNNALKKLFKRKKVNAAIKGYIRKLEITYNQERDDYNPHFHVILAVNKSYFTDKRYYISHQEWLDIWRDVTGLSTITQLHITKVRKGRGKHGEDSAINEIAKYSAKDSEMLLSEEVFDVFYSCMKGRRLLAFNGVFKDYKKRFDNKELEEYFDKDENEYIWKMFATWNEELKKYEQIYELLTENEYQKYNGQAVEELDVKE